MTPTEIYTTLNTDSGVRAIVGENVSPQQSRAYFGHAGESPTRPYIVFYAISLTNLDTIGGVGDMERALYQFNCIVDAETSTALSADALADALESAFEGTGFRSLRLYQYDKETKSHMTIVQWSFLN